MYYTIVISVFTEFFLKVSSRRSVYLLYIDCLDLTIFLAAVMN